MTNQPTRPTVADRVYANTARDYLAAGNTLEARYYANKIGHVALRAEVMREIKRKERQQREAQG